MPEATPSSTTVTWRMPRALASSAALSSPKACCRRTTRSKATFARSPPKMATPSEIAFRCSGSVRRSTEMRRQMSRRISWLRSRGFLAIG